jgi:diguanylate cyclase (GGDEF)-like protein
VTTAAAKNSGRLLIVGDVDRLRPALQDGFGADGIVSIRTYLQGIAEIGRGPTHAVLVGHDADCRQPERALAAIKAVAGPARVVFCCDPAYESLGRRLTHCGADDYVIFPPDSQDLERALGLPSRVTRDRWIQAPVVAPAPSAEELARLAELMPRLVAGMDRAALDAMAALVCCAIRSESASVVLEERTGQAGENANSVSQATLVEPILRGAERIGQIRVGPSRAGGYTHEDTAKLRHYGVLLGRLLEGAGRAEEWRRLAYTDDLTELPNRRQLMDFLDDKLARAADSRTPVTVLVFDIDDFKRYNDRYGHDAGDEILRDTGRLFQQCSRTTDLVARYGGDEFVVVFWDAEAPRTLGSHHPNEFLPVVQRFRAALARHTFSRLGPEATGCLTISGGLAQFPWQARSGEELIAAADKALLQAKAAGKNRFWLIGSGDLTDSPPANDSFQ